MNTWQAIKAFFGFPPTTPPSGAVLGEASPSPKEALKQYVRAPQIRGGNRYVRARPAKTIYVPPAEDHTLRDVAIGVAVGAALSSHPHHTEDYSPSPSSSSSDDSSSSSSDSFSSGGGSCGGGGASDDF